MHHEQFLKDLEARLERGVQLTNITPEEAKEFKEAYISAYANYLARLAIKNTEEDQSDVA